MPTGRGVFAPCHSCPASPAIPFLTSANTPRPVGMLESCTARAQPARVFRGGHSLQNASFARRGNYAQLLMDTRARNCNKLSPDTVHLRGASLPQLPPLPVCSTCKNISGSNRERHQLSNGVVRALPRIMGTVGVQLSDRAGTDELNPQSGIGWLLKRRRLRPAECGKRLASLRSGGGAELRRWYRFGGGRKRKKAMPGGMALIADGEQWGAGSGRRHPHRDLSPPACAGRPESRFRPCRWTRVPRPWQPQCGHGARRSARSCCRSPGRSWWPQAWRGRLQRQNRA